MNLWIRLFWMLITAPFRGRISEPDGLSRITMRVWPNDLDLNVHMNNGRYLTCADVGRLDLLVRSGLLRMVWRHGWRPIMSGVAIRYRRELTLFQKFAVETRVVYWSDRTLVMEHVFVTGEGEARSVSARELVACGFYDRAARAFVSAKEAMIAASGHAHDSPPATPEIEAFLASFEALKEKKTSGAEQA